MREQSTNWELGPTLRCMMRNKIGAALIALQIAVTMAVVVNSAAIIAERRAAMNRPSGLVEDELFHISVRGYTPNFDALAALENDLALLRQTPGVVAATPVNSIPMRQSGQVRGLYTQPGPDHEMRSAAVYMVDDHGIDTLGVELIAGRDFGPADVRERVDGVSDWPPNVILSAAMASGLWPQADPSQAVGRTVFIGADEPLTVIGIVATLQGPWPSAPNLEDTMLVPDKIVSNSVRYMVRTEPGRRDELMPVVEEALAKANRQRIVRAPESMAETRALGYWLDAGISTMLGVVMAALLLITSFGIVGLASFSVRQRIRQIGTRRALGATKADILRYFLVENLLIATGGVLIGAALTIGLNVVLVERLGVAKVEWYALPLGMATLLVLGLLAVLWPARRATAVPPAVATRTV